MLSCIKYIVILYNLIFWLLGLIVLGLCVFVFMDLQTYTQFEGSQTSALLLAPFIVLVIIGILTTLVGFLGCCGAVCESRCLLSLYFFFCISMCLASTAAIFWANTHGQEVRNGLERDYRSVIQNHYSVGSVGATDIIVDVIQRDFECCGASGPSDWATSKYNAGDKNLLVDLGVGSNFALPGTYRLPESCCEPGFERCGNDIRDLTPTTIIHTVAGLHRNGCVEKLANFVDEKWQLLIIIGSILAGVQLFSLIFACILCCAISRDEDDK